MSKQGDQTRQALAGGLPGLAPESLDAFPHPAAILDETGGIVSANAAFSSEIGLATDDGLRAAEALLTALEGEQGHTVSLPGREEPRLVDLLTLPLDRPDWRLVMAIDRTVDVHMRSALAISRRRFKELVEISSDHAWETDAGGTFSMITPRGLAGRESADLLGELPASLFDPAMPAPALSPFSTPVPVEGVEVWMLDIEGHSLCFEVSAVPLFDSDGAWTGARGICRDVTRDRRYRTHLAEHRDQERILTRITGVFRAEANPDDMLRLAASASTHGFSAHGCQILTAPASVGDDMPLKLGVAAYFGKVDEKLPLDPVLDPLLAEDGADVQVLPYGEWSVLAARTIYAAHTVGAILLWRGPGRPPWTEGEKNLLRSVAGQLAAVVELRAKYHALFDISRSDPLTGVLNRRGFYDEVRRRFSRMQRGTSATATLVYCDLDNFKLVNDVHGHAKGDEALRHVADILRNNSRSTDLVARLGGDEFAVWLDNAGEAAAVARAQVFLSAARSLHRYSGTQARPLGISIGMAVYNSASHETINDFFSRADAAMYRVKRDGKGSYAVAPAAGR